MKKTYFLATVIHFKSSLMKFMADSSNVVLVDMNKDIAEVMQILAKLLKKIKILLSIQKVQEQEMVKWINLKRPLLYLLRN